MKKIAVIGSINMDLVVTLDKHPVPGETVKSSSYEKHIGGKGCNQAVAAAKLGGDVLMVGCVGQDEDGITLKSHLMHENVDVSEVSQIEHVNTGMAIVMIDQHGENEIVVISGSNHAFSKQHLENIIEKLSLYDIWLLQLEIPIDVIAYAIKKGRELGKTVILNPAPAISLHDIDINAVDFITPNLIELEMLAKMKITDDATLIEASMLLVRNGIEHVIVTLGKKGIFYANAKDKFFIEGKNVNVVDTTGAGDCFNGAFAAGIANGKSIRDSLEIAVAASALSVTQKGAQTGMPDESAVMAFLTQNESRRI